MKDDTLDYKLKQLIDSKIIRNRNDLQLSSIREDIYNEVTKKYFSNTAMHVSEIDYNAEALNDVWEEVGEYIEDLIPDRYKTPKAKLIISFIWGLFKSFLRRTRIVLFIVLPGFLFCQTDTLPEYEFEDNDYVLFDPILPNQIDTLIGVCQIVTDWYAATVEWVPCISVEEKEHIPHNLSMRYGGVWEPYFKTIRQDYYIPEYNLLKVINNPSEWTVLVPSDDLITFKQRSFEGAN